MRSSLFYALALVATGCATASKPGFDERPDSGIHVLDSNGSNLDAPASNIDAPVQGGSQTLTETTSSTDEAIAVACGDGSTYTTHTSYYRVFALSAFGITGAFNVSEVDFVVSSAAANPQLKVSVGTYSGSPGGATLDTTAISLATNKSITVASTDTSESVPLTSTIPAGGNVVVEVDQTSKGTTSNGVTFYIGANSQTESAPGYISSPAADCNMPIPTSMTQVAGTQTSLILTVTGST